MANVPTWIIDQVRFRSFDFSSHLPSIKKSINLEKSRVSRLRLSSKLQIHNRNSSVLERPPNPLLYHLEFNERCQNLWSKFDSKASPVLKKSSFKSFQRSKNQERILGKFNRIIKKKAKNKPFHPKFKTTVEVDLGIQCELSSESSYLDIDLETTFLFK
jgi:hypothetical protein